MAPLGPVRIFRVVNYPELALLRGDPTLKGFVRRSGCRSNDPYLDRITAASRSFSSCFRATCAQELDGSSLRYRVQ
jgi:hypothetical protein